MIKDFLQTCQWFYRAASTILFNTYIPLSSWPAKLWLQTPITTAISGFPLQLCEWNHLESNEGSGSYLWNLFLRQSTIAWLNPPRARRSYEKQYDSFIDKTPADDNSIASTTSCTMHWKHWLKWKDCILRYWWSIIYVITLNHEFNMTPAVVSAIAWWKRKLHWIDRLILLQKPD